MTKTKDKPIDPNAIHMVFGKHHSEKNTEDNDKAVGAAGWVMAWEKKKTEYEDCVPVKKGNLIKLKKNVGSHLKVGDVIMFLHLEELILNTDIKFDVRIDAESLWDKEKANYKLSDEEMKKLSNTIQEMNKPRKIISYHVHALAGEKTVDINIESPEVFLEYFEPIEVK